MLELLSWDTKCLEKQLNHNLLLTCLKIWWPPRLLCGLRYAQALTSSSLLHSSANMASGYRKRGTTFNLVESHVIALMTVEFDPSFY